MTGTVVKSMWAMWLARCDRTGDARPLAWLRIALPLCVVADLLRVVQLGLVDVVFLPHSLGGLSRFQDPHLLIVDLLGASAGGIALVVTILCMLLVSMGVWMKPAILLGVLAYAQLGHLYPPGDRAIDRIIRTALLFLLFSAADQHTTFRRAKQTIIAIWPADLLRFFLVLVYLSAGVAKLLEQPGWLSMTAEPPLLRILTDPMSGQLDPMIWTAHSAWFRWGGFFTIAIELSSPLLLTRYAHFWAIGGLCMHIGITLTMSLGMFGWGMLAFYPWLLAPFILAPAKNDGSRPTG